MDGIVYKYTSPSGKVYIGQTCRERGRRNDFNENGEYGGSRIDNARKKYGPQNFKYEVLFRITSDNKDLIKTELNEKEQYFIKEYRSNEYKFGYNMNDGGAGNVAFAMSEEARHKISQSTRKWLMEKGHPLKGIGHTKESIEKMRKNTKKKFGKDNPNYGWKPSKEVLEKLSRLSSERVGEKNPFYGRHHTEENKQKARKRFGRAVIQYDAETLKEIARDESANQAPEVISASKRGASEIGKVCNGYVNSRGSQYITALGYRWKWADEADKDFKTYKAPVYNPRRGFKKSDGQKLALSIAHSRKVCQIDVLTGEIVKVHDSATKAATELGHPKSNSDIGKMCNGKLNGKRVLGFRWKWFSPE